MCWTTRGSTRRHCAPLKIRSPRRIAASACARRGFPPSDTGASPFRRHRSHAGPVLTVVFVRDRMVGRGTIPRTVAGYAGAADPNGARTAFVLPDRTARIAWRAGVSHSRVLGVVIAHELAHLLLPNRPHARVGLTRGNWVPADFRDSRHWKFSADDAASIRASIAGLMHGMEETGD